MTLSMPLSSMTRLSKVQRHFKLTTRLSRNTSTMTDSWIRYREVKSKTHPHAKIGILSLNRPESRNALSRKMIETLKSHLRTVESTDSCVRGLILTSSVAGGTFCAGADLVERRSMTPDQVSRFLDDMRLAFTQLSALDMPTVSVIEGYALGGGLELSLCTDFRVLGPSAKLGLPETSLGIIPGAGGTQRMTRLIGLARTKELIFSGRVVDSKEALSYGIADYVVHTTNETRMAESLNVEAEEESDAMKKAVWLMDSFIRNSPTSLAQAKRAIHYAATSGTTLERGLDYERDMYDVCMQGPDRLEGLRAFQEKRKPIYGAPDSIHDTSSPPSSSSLIKRSKL